MSWPTALETLLSLALQIAVLYAVTRAIDRGARSEDSKDRIWNAFYLLVLGLTALAWCGPHLRFVSPRFVFGTPRAGGAWDWQYLVSLILVGLWGLGVTLGTTSLVLGIIASLRQLRGTKAYENSQLVDLLSQHYDILAKCPTVALRLSDSASRPYCWQLTRPVIVLPAQIVQAPAEIVRPIVLHELAHLRLNHPLHLFLQHVVEILFWYHPVVWRAGRHANLQREIVADFHAVGSRSEAVQYLKGLLLISDRNNITHSLPVGLALLGNGSEVQERVRRLVERDWDQKHSCLELRRFGSQLAVAVLCMIIWLPLNPMSSSRSVWSPWPEWTAVALHAVGINVRDYEIDSHRLTLHHTHQNSVQ